MRSARAKRTIDVAVAVAGLALFALPMAAIAVVILLRIGRPVLFVQERPGLHGEIFKLYKFRTMRNDRHQNGELLPDEQRITAFGRALRATSLDELPELWHVLQGDMSLVGPRPLLPEYLDLYSPEQARRHEVRPGLTGLVQVEGRNALSWERKFELDVWYVDNWSLWLDLRIAARTFWAVVTRQGISQDGHVSAERFRGTQRSDTPDETLD